MQNGVLASDLSPSRGARDACGWGIEDPEEHMGEVAMLIRQRRDNARSGTRPASR